MACSLRGSSQNTSAKPTPERLLRRDADRRTVSGITRSYLPGPWIYLAATLIALLSPAVSIALFGVIALFYVVESSWFGRGRSRSQP